jgi:DNA helicase-2/ATP-dependent DNA helicase PcrA
MAAEPSQFLNELPLEMIEDLSYGSSWLSFARSSTTKSNKMAASALRGELPPPKPKNVYTGKTYNSTDAIAEFFKKRNGGQAAGDDTPKPAASTPRRIIPATNDDAGQTPYGRLKAAASPEKRTSEATPKGLVPGEHVRHEKYGKGLVLRREGSGDNIKLTVSFPGFGQKKLIEKYANLQKA